MIERENGKERKRRYGNRECGKMGGRKEPKREIEGRTNSAKEAQKTEGRKRGRVETGERRETWEIRESRETEREIEEAETRKRKLERN